MQLSILSVFLFDVLKLKTKKHMIIILFFKAFFMNNLKYKQLQRFEVNIKYKGIWHDTILVLLGH